MPNIYLVPESSEDGKTIDIYRLTDGERIKVATIKRDRRQPIVFYPGNERITEILLGKP